MCQAELLTDKSNILMNMENNSADGARPLIAHSHISSCVVRFGPWRWAGEHDGSPAEFAK